MVGARINVLLDWAAAFLPIGLRCDNGVLEYIQDHPCRSNPHERPKANQIG